MRGLLRTLLLSSVLMSAHSIAAQVEIFDRHSGQSLPTYVKHGRTYVAGEPGHEYEVRIRNEVAARVLAVTTVDGVNVITGQTGAVSQSGYVLDGYGDVRIEGWRKSMSRTAAFFFTKLSNSYAARTGRPDNVGVIGIALFRERTPCCRPEEELQRSSRMEDRAQGGVGAEARAKGAPAPSLQERSVDADSPPSSRSEPKLGTGHGRSEYSAAQYTEFVRASSTPSETIVIYYDSEKNLVAQGIIPRQQHLASRPRPFPGSFVPDP